jgi:Family of unknown function (DUF5996)
MSGGEQEAGPESSGSGATGQSGSGWPAVPVAGWQDTRDTLHLWTQVVGKVVLARTPLVNHWWNITLHVTADGLETPLIPDGTRRGFQMTFDFLDDQLDIVTTDDHRSVVRLEPRSVADFYAEVMGRLDDFGLHTPIWPMPVEIEGAIPFTDDHEHASYDGDAARRFWRSLVESDRVMRDFRSRFLGKASPVHFFWGAFDLATTRFSGRTAPPHPGQAPNCGPQVMREAYSHEVSSCGFWAGTAPIDYPAFYAYAYPEPPGFANARVRPEGAFYSPDFREFVFPYDRVRESSSPDDTLLEFLQSTYEAAADLGRWDRAALERASVERSL